MRSPLAAAFACLIATGCITTLGVFVHSAAGKEPVEKELNRTDRYGVPLPKGAVARLGCGSFAQPYSANSASLAFSPDGKFLVSISCSDKLIRLWNPNSGWELRAFEGHTDQVNCFALSADGRWLASGGRNNELFLWEFTTGKIQRRFRGHNAPIERLALSPDGKVLASTCSERTLRLWDTGAGKEIHSLSVDKGHGVWGMTFTPDSKHFAFCDNYEKGIHLVDAATGKVIREFKGHTRHVNALAFTVDGGTLLSGSDDHTLRAWDVASGKERRRYGDQKQSIYRLAVSPDRKTVAYVTGRVVHFLHLATGNEVLAPWNTSPGDAQCLGYSPDGTKLAAGGLRIAILDTLTGKRLNPDPESLTHVQQIEYAAGGKVLVVWRVDSTIELWNTAKWRKQATLRPKLQLFTSMACSPDGKYLTTAERGHSQAIIRHWYPQTGEKQKEFPAKDCWFESLSYTADGKTLGYFQFGPDGRETFIIWDAVANKERRRIQGPHRSFVSDLRLSPDGRYMIQGAERKTVQLWDTKTDYLLHSFGEQSPRFPSALPAFSPDGRTIAAPGERHGEGGKQIEPEIVLWGSSTRKERLRIVSNEGPLTQFAFSPDGRLLATAGQWETIHLWESWTGKEVGRFAGHRGRIHSLSFAPDGKTLASAGEDKTVLIWDVSGFPRVTKPVAEKLSRQQLHQSWDDLRSEDGRRAYAAMAKLSEHPAQAESFLQGKLTAHLRVEAERLAHLIADLDNDDFTKREGASKELAGLARLAEGALRKTLQGKPSAEVKRRIQRLLEKLDRNEEDPVQCRLLRTIEVLERLGTPPARKLLRRLVEAAPYASTTREAKASLERFGKTAKDVH